ncbi:hypothetical protein K4F52_005781 [Lecanicillium sp. MT-2017a]|nr:hypothetical protein K4F52_005781 [Lecanicillium sp. MT-2017a]
MSAIALSPLQRQFLSTSSQATLRQLYNTTSRTRTSFFSTCQCLRAAKPQQPKIVKTTTTPKPPKTGSAPAPQAQTRYAFIKNLGSKTTPTILYESPSHFWFYFGCWSSGTTILAWTLLTGPTVVQQPEGIPPWVGYIFGASYVLLGSMGFYLISKTPNIVRSIRLVPSQVAATSATTAGPAGTAATRGVTTSTPVPKIEITVNRMMPFLPPKVVTTNLDNVALKSRFSLPDEYVPELRRLEMQRQEEAARSELRKFDMQHLLTMPFRRLGRAVSGFFGGVRAAWTDMGYGVIRVDGKHYKVDVTKGFAHDGFKTLERLVAVGY